MYPRLGGKPVSYTHLEDVHRKLDEISTAEFAIVPITIEACSGVPDAPEFRNALKSFDLAWEGKHFEVFRRRVTP